MTEALIVVFILLIVGLHLGASYLDVKHQWRLVDWFSGECANPFAPRASAATNQPSECEKDEQIATLTERVQVLEKIINEPAYELNKKINALK